MNFVSTIINFSQISSLGHKIIIKSKLYTNLIKFLMNMLQCIRNFCVFTNTHVYSRTHNIICVFTNTQFQTWCIRNFTLLLCMVIADLSYGYLRNVLVLWVFEVAYLMGV